MQPPGQDFGKIPSPGQADPPGFAPAWMAWSTWGLAAFFFAVGFFQRVAPAVMTSELMADFSIGAASLGNLASFYLYSYAAMQIPTGLLADAWSPRRLLTIGTLTAALGTLVFALSPSFFWACLGRLLFGGSVGVGYVLALKLASHWFPARRFGLTAGLTFVCGVSGALLAGLPLRLLIVRFGWRPVMLAVGALTLALAAAIWLFVRDDPSEKGFRSHAPGPIRRPAQTERHRLLAGLGQVFGFRNTWVLVLAPGAMIGAMLSFAGLWGVPFLKARFGLPPAEGAAVCSLLMISWAVGGPILGGVSDRLGRRKPIYLVSYIVIILGWAGLIYLPGISLATFLILIVLAGFATGAVVLSFAIGKESVPAGLAGTVLGVINTGFMIGPMIQQPVTGWLLDLNWRGQMAGGARVYDLAAYQTGFLPMIGWAVLACVLVCFTRETYCGQAAEGGPSRLHPGKAGAGVDGGANLDQNGRP